MPENRQIRLLAREGIHISNTTLNSYIHNGIAKLREFMEDAVSYTHLYRELSKH